MCKLLLLAFVGLAASASVHQKTEEDAKEDRQAYAINYCANYMWPAGNYPYPTDCRKYISCANGVTNVMPCPATTVYNPNLRVCDNPQNVPTCNYNAPANVNPIYLNNYCTANGYGNGMYFHPYDCSSYINCNYGVTTVSGCPAGSVWDSVSRQCVGWNNGVVRPNNMPWCNQYVFNAPVQGNYQPGYYNNFCSLNGRVNGVYPDPYNCYGYIQCNYGQALHQQCPAGLSFDSNLLVCDDQRYNNCNGVVGK